MAEEIWVRGPDGAVYTISERQYQSALNQGFTNLTPEEAAAAQDSEIRDIGQQEAVTQGLLQAPDDYSRAAAFAERVGSNLTFGQAFDSAGARARGLRYQEEHPYGTFAADFVGGMPYAVAGSAGAGAVAGAAGLGTLGAAALDFGVSAAVGGGQTEGVASTLEGRDFSFTNMAITGAVGEAIGRGGFWAASRALGGSRNLLARAERDLVAQDVERSLAKGGWVNDYRVAQHADQYHTELAELAARDLDTLEESFAEVSRQDRKRARITRVVADQPEVQGAVRVEAATGLRELRAALSDELAEAGGPAKKLLKQLDDRIAALEDGRTGRKLWRTLDENRQALQEYRQDLHQAYEANPGSAWLSREGLAAIDAAEAATRESLLREDVWGAEAARMQREYNVPFHEKYFPTAKTVRAQLMFSPQRNAEGFPVYRGEPGHVRRFLTRAADDVDGNRLGEQFREYLDGVEAIARAGEKDTPQAAHRTLEAVRRLRKAVANAAYITEAAARTRNRQGALTTGIEVAGAVAGTVAAGPGAGALGYAALRGARVGDFLHRAGARLGWGAGRALSMADLLARGARETPAGRDAPLVVDDLLDAADGGGPKPPPTEPPSGPPAGGGGGGLTPSILADARRGSWRPTPAPESGVSVRPGATAPDDLAPEPEADLAAMGRPSREERAATPTVRIEGREVGRGQQERLELDGLRDASGPARREAARLQALTEGEFRDVVGQLKATGEPEAKELAQELESNLDQLRTAGLVVAAVGGTALAAAEDSPEGAMGASAAGLGLLLRGRGLPFKQAVGALKLKYSAGEVNKALLAFHQWMKKDLGWSEAQISHHLDSSKDPFRLLADVEAESKAAGGLAMMTRKGLTRFGKLALDLGKSQMLGAKFFGKEEAARAIAARARSELGPPPPLPASTASLLSGPSGAVLGKTSVGGIDQLIQMSRRRLNDLDPPERRALQDWVGSSGSLRHQQRTGLPRNIDDTQVLDPEEFDAPAFESAVDKLMVVDPTKHGPLFRFIDLPDTAVAELLTRDDFIVGATMSTGYMPDPNFGAVELRFNRVDRAGALIGLNPAEWEMLVPKDSRFKVTGRYWNEEKGGYVFTLDEVPETRELAANLADVGYLTLPAAGAAALAAEDDAEGAGAAAPLAGMALFGRRASLFKSARARTVADVAKRLFSATAEPAARVAARLTYDRATLKARQEEFQAWQANPQELVDRVAEGFRDVPPEHSGTVAAGVFRTATFLKARLPTVTKLNAVSLRQIPVSTEAMNKYARYEAAALRPREALQDAAATGHVSAELLETLEELYPDLLAELRVGAILQVRENGPPTTVQAKLNYARLFGGRGELADPSMSQTVANMTAYAYEQAVPVKPGGGPTSSGNVSHVAAASAAPRMGLAG